VNACVHTYTKPRTSSTRSRGIGRRIHGSVEDTKLSTNKQHTLSLSPSELESEDVEEKVDMTRSSCRFTLHWRRASSVGKSPFFQVV